MGQIPDYCKKKNFKVYSVDQLISRTNTIIEVETQIDKIEDRQQYKKSNWRNRVLNQRTFFEQKKLQIEWYEDNRIVKEALDLYDRWWKQVKHKKHRIMFPYSRYRRCISSLSYHKKVKAIVCKYQEELQAMRIILEEGNIAYDLCVASDKSKLGNGLGNAFAFHSMKSMAERGINRVNHGLVSDKGMLKHKTAYPHEIKQMHLVMGNEVIRPPNTCLLYTSPSPRDS